MVIPKIEELNAATCRTCSFQKRWPEFYEHLLSTYPEGSFSEKLAMHYHNLRSVPVCIVCGKPVKFVNFRTGWRRTCCSKCQGQDPEVISKRTQTMQERYGEDNPGKVKAFQHKMKQTCLERYGVENAGWTKESQQKIKETNLKRRGVEYAMQSEEVRKKSKQTCLHKYGVAHNTSAQHIKAKVAATNELKYGGTGYASTILLEKSISSCKKRYGVLPLGDRVLRTKREADLILKDVIGYTHDLEWICKCPHPECKKCTEKYYVTDPDLRRSREHVGAELCTKLLPVKSQHSTLELWICNILDSAGVRYEIGNRFILGGKELDVYCPDLNVAFECNGIYWHSSIYKANSYHRNKTTLALNNGIRLYHIWEDWVHNSPEILHSMILNWVGKSSYKIFARKCAVKEVSGAECREFLINSHIQGNSPSTISYGLYHHDKLVSIMTFGHKRGCVGKVEDKGHKDEWELIRFCSALQTNVVGGASKLLKHFIKNHNPSLIYSYASRDISVGNVYKSLGFVSDGKITSSYWYIEPSTFHRYHRTSFTKSRIIKLGWKDSKDGWTEAEAMAEHGYLQIYDAGQTKWTLIPENQAVGEILSSYKPS